MTDSSDLAQRIARRVASNQGNREGPNPGLNPENNELARSIAHNLAKARGVQEDPGGGGILGAGMGLLGRTFDVLSRPLYGVAEGVKSTIEGENALEGVWQGISGQEKTTFSDVLESAGVENDFIRGVGGFALDIALDPTTYIGGGIIKGVAGEAVATQVGKSAAKIIARDAERTLVGKTAIREAIKAGAIDGASKKARQKIASEALLDEGLGKVVGLADELAASQKGKFVFKYMGKEIGSGSERLYSAGRKIADKAKGTRTGNAFNKAFRNEATFTAGTNSTRRMFEGQSIAHAEELAHTIKKGGRIPTGETIPAFSKLSPDQSKLVRDALEDGTDLSSHILDSGESLQDFVNAGRLVQRGLGEAEAGIDEGILKFDDIIDDNFLHHSFDYKKSDPAAIRRWNQERRKEINGYLKAKKNAIKAGKEVPVFKPQLTLAEAAKRDGLVPIEDISHVLGDAIGSSFKQQGRARFVHAIAGEFGVPMWTDLSEKVAKNRGKEAARRLGLREVSGDARKYLPEGYVFPKEIAEAAEATARVMHDEAAGSALRDLYDSGLSNLKILQTVANPGHHLRNLFSDMNMNFLAGVTDARHYSDAARILRRMGKLADGEDIGEEVMHVVGKVKMSDSDIYRHYMNSGAKAGFYRTEIAKQGDTVAGRMVEKIRGWSEVREDFARLAHFTDKVKKYGKDAKNPIQLNEAFEKAAQDVRKFNIDYGDLTPFEQRTMKRVVPFYTWMRKNTPLQMENLFFRPGRQVVVPKALKAINTALGNDDPSSSFGVDFLPDYMRQAMSVRLVGEGEGRNGTYWNPSGLFPVMSLDDMFGGEGGLTDIPSDIVENQLAGLTPLARLPVEQVTGHDFFTGRPTDRSFGERLVTQIPLGRIGYQSTVGGGEQPLALTLGNWATGAGVREVTQGQIAGELRRQEDIVQTLLRRRNEERQRSLAEGR